MHTRRLTLKLHWHPDRLLVATFGSDASPLGKQRDSLKVFLNFQIGHSLMRRATATYTGLSSQTAALERAPTGVFAP